MNNKNEDDASIVAYNVPSHGVNHYNEKDSDDPSSFPVHECTVNNNEAERDTKKRRKRKEKHSTADEQQHSAEEGAPSKTKRKKPKEKPNDAQPTEQLLTADGEFSLKRKKRKKKEVKREGDESNTQVDPSAHSVSECKKTDISISAHSHYEVIDAGDFIVQDNPTTDRDEKNEVEHKEENLEEKKAISNFQSKSIRQNGIYVENPVSGQFNRMRNFKEANDELLNQDENENEEEILMGEEIDRVNFEMQTSIRQVHSNLSILIYSVESLLAGFSLLILLASFVPSIKNFTSFISWYAPLAEWCEKIFHVVTTMSLVSSVYMLINELSPLQRGGNTMNLSSFFSTLPDLRSKNHREVTDDDADVNRTRFQKVRDRLRNTAHTNSTIVLVLGLQCIVYGIMYYTVLGNLVQEDYFAIRYSKRSNWLEYLPSSGSERKEFEKRVIIWHVLNIIRCLCAIIGWLLSLLSIRINRHVQNQGEYSLYKLRLDYDSKLEQLFRLEQYYRLREENDIIYSSSLGALKTGAMIKTRQQQQQSGHKLE